MSRPRRIPLRGDIPAAAVAELLGLSASEFQAKLDQLHERGFPNADATTGLLLRRSCGQVATTTAPAAIPRIDDCIGCGARWRGV